MTNNFSASSSAPHFTVQPQPQKDYQAAFGILQSQYGMGGFPTPSLPKTGTNTRKWWGSRSSSTASLIQSTTPSDVTHPPSRPAVPTRGTLTESELQLGKLMAEYGFGPVSQAHRHK